MISGLAGYRAPFRVGIVGNQPILVEMVLNLRIAMAS